MKRDSRGNVIQPTTPFLNKTLPSPSSSASASAAQDLLTGEYEVFLSFRGGYSRQCFTDFLYTYLHGAGVRTFSGDNNPRVGEEIGPELLRAIKGSKISIPIFTTNYASSKRCLLELAQIWDCHRSAGQIIVPIFNDVDPDTVEHQKRSYKAAFRKHRKRGFDEMIVQGWEKALTEVGRLEGFELKNKTSREVGELVKVIVQKVLLALKKNYMHVPENLVGMEHHVEEMKRLLEVESSGVRIVGICGMGGLGKTTIAKVIYNQLWERFDHCCFLDDVQDKSKQDKDIVNLQNQLLSKIQNKEVSDFDDFNVGRDMIKDAVRGKKVLLVLDNVDRNFQIDKLVGSHHWFGNQSRIIITTRNYVVLGGVVKTCPTEGLPKVYTRYEPPLLNHYDSLRLFCMHAFMRDSPPAGYDDLAKRFVCVVEGLPLILVTLGSSLFAEKDKDIWEEKLRELKNVPPQHFIERLRFSFEALKYREKQIFLEIACLLNKVNKRELRYMWDACEFYPRVGLSILVHRSLITIGGDDIPIMHKGLRDLGKQIIREEGLSELGKQSRLHAKEVLQVLKARQRREEMKRDRKGNVIQPTTSILTKTLPSPSASAAEDLLTGEYEVFLSFRGADTRDGFTDFLYNDLVGAGVRTFRDDNELRVGEEIDPELLRAIKGSKISIPIFSNNYANSKWCLREFSQMVECRENGAQMIFPIFYDVEPNEVQHYDRGSYKEAFLEHEKSTDLDEKTVQQWKKALEKVGDLKGLELKKVTNKREGEFVKIVVEEVLSKLKKNYKHVPENLVGMDSHIEEMERLLNIGSNDVRIIGILGMGGLGKTTIAKVIYNQFCELFECHCFLEDVRENLSSNGIINLQNQLLSNILKRKISKLDDVDEGVLKIKDAIRGRKVLIVLDDVDKNFQIDKLAGNHNWYEAGSRVIITTRNEEILIALEVCMSYRPELMNPNHSLKLFSKYAFMRDSPPKGYDILAKDVVSNAGGIPLVLVTIGSLLSIEKDKGSWQEKLKKLKEIPPEEVLQRLRISYDALDYHQKQIFLDIACFFAGMDKINPCYMWDHCKFYPLEGINALVRRSLITVTNNNALKMHDQLRDLGRQIVDRENWEEPGKRSRLWRHHEALDTLKEHRGTEEVKALCLQFEEGTEYRCPCLVGQDFAKLRNLRYLSVVFADLDGDFKGLHSNLRWLQWRGCSGNFMPTNFNMKNLVILDLSYSAITDDYWKGWSQIKMAKELKVLNLSHCMLLRRVPHLSTFASLESLEVDHCRLLCSLDGLEHLESLRYLDTSHCAELERLPDLSKLGKLQTLNVCWNRKNLTAIQGLDKLESLELLNMSHCYSVRRLPNLSNLKKLRTLNASYCDKIMEIQGLDKLESLEDMDMVHCRSLERVPDLSNLKKLRKLKSEDWKVTEVHGLGGLEFLECLTMKDHTCLERLSDLSNLRRLRKLKIWSCDKLIEIQGLHRLESLEDLEMRKCRSIESLPDLSNLKRLKRLQISSFDKLIEIQGLDGLDSLESLDLSYCISLERLPDFSNLRKLEHLDVSHCRTIEILPGLPNYGMLKHVDLRSCTKLYEIESLRVVKSLESLNLSLCEALGNILDLPRLKNLKTLEICFCLGLTKIWGLEELESLELLDIEGCEFIENLPDISNLRNLKKIDVSYCVKLTEIRGLEELESLEMLDIQGCKSIENLPDISNLRNLKYRGVSY